MDFKKRPAPVNDGDLDINLLLCNDDTLLSSLDFTKNLTIVNSTGKISKRPTLSLMKTNSSASDSETESIQIQSSSETMKRNKSFKKPASSSEKPKYTQLKIVRNNDIVSNKTAPLQPETDDSYKLFNDSFQFFEDTQSIVNKSKECSSSKENSVKNNNGLPPLSCDISNFNWQVDTQAFLEEIKSKLNKPILPVDLENPGKKSTTQKSLNKPKKHCNSKVTMTESKRIETSLNTNNNDTVLKNILNNFDSQDIFASQVQDVKVTQSNNSYFVSEWGAGCSSQFSQLFENSQFLKSLDKKTANSSEIKQTQNLLNVKENQTIKKTKKKTSEDNHKIDECDYSISEVLNNDEYRKEVDMLFRHVETSICQLGPNQDETLNNSAVAHSANTSSFVQSIVKLIRSPEKEITNKLDWNDRTAVTNAILNMSSTDCETTFSEIIKKALLENAKKTAEPVGALSNCTLKSPENDFKVLGEFFGLPNKVKDLLKAYKGIEHLYDWQKECLNLPAVKSRKNLVYALPTSGGKTLVAEILILREILCRKRNVLFVLPYVSIVQEKVWSLSPFGVALEFLIEEYAAGKGTFPPRKRRRKNSVYVATIEKALGLVNSLVEKERLDELGLVVVDELHLVGDLSRGSTLEALLTKLMFLKCNLQIVGMSATIGNLEEICTFLNADVYTQNFRPVELTEYVKCGDEIAKVNGKPASREELFTLVRKVTFSYTESVSRIDPDRIGGLVMEVVPDSSCLIFCSTKKNCENVALLLCKVLFPKLKQHKQKEKKDLIQSLTEETTVLCSVLKSSIPFGVAYHHSGLTSEERKLIEDAFREGIISVICCTSTLAAGVNLPAKRVILRQPYIGRDFINLSRYKQMVGRAGRTGFGESGESILLCTSQELPKVKELFMSPMDLSLSSMAENNKCGLKYFILSCISLNLAKTRRQILKIVDKTLLSLQQDRLNINVKKCIDEVLTYLFKTGALKPPNGESTQSSVSSLSNVSFEINSSTSAISHAIETSKPKMRITVTNDSILEISKLGTAAIKAGLDLSKAHVLYEDLLQAQQSLVLLDCLHLLYLVTPYDVSEQVTPTKSLYYTLFTQLGSTELQTAKVLGITESCAARMLSNQRIKSVSERVLNRFYVTLMLYDLWNETSVYQVAEKYQVNRGLIQNLMTSAATFASNVVNFCEELEEFWAFSHLLKGMSLRLSHCCVRDLMPLMELPAVKQNRAKQLFNAGYKNLQSIAKADPNELINNIEFMSRKLANQLIAASKLLLLEKVENLREEAEDVLDGVENHNIVMY